MLLPSSQEAPLAVTVGAAGLSYGIPFSAKVTLNRTCPLGLQLNAYACAYIFGLIVQWGGYSASRLDRFLWEMSCEYQDSVRLCTCGRRDYPALLLHSVSASNARHFRIPTISVKVEISFPSLGGEHFGPLANATNPASVDLNAAMPCLSPRCQPLRLGLQPQGKDRPIS